MKPYTIIAILAISMLAVSCISDDEMLTVVNADGSCYREFTRISDSTFMIGDTAKSNPFPVDLDSGWIITWKYLSPEIHTNWPVKNWKWNPADTNRQVIVTARHEFGKAEDMAAGFRLSKTSGWHDLKVQYVLEKKFRWFYTYYTYREVYPKIKTFTDVPLEKYMTKEEADFWFTGKTDLIKGMNGIEIKEFTDNLDEKANKWFAHNYWNEQYKLLLKNYDKLKNTVVSKKRLEQARDSIFEKNISSMQDGSWDKNMDKILDDYFKTKFFTSLTQIENNPLNDLGQSIDNLTFIGYFGKSFDYKLLLPGKIVQSNNAVLLGDTLNWKLTAYRMVYSDYEITAQSRKANTWAFVVSGLIVILAFGSYFYKSRS